MYKGRPNLKMVLADEQLNEDGSIKLLSLLDTAQLTINNQGNGTITIYFAEVDENNSLILEIDCLESKVTLARFGKFDQGGR